MYSMCFAAYSYPLVMAINLGSSINSVLQVRPILSFFVFYVAVVSMMPHPVKHLSVLSCPLGQSILCIWLPNLHFTIGFAAFGGIVRQSYGVYVLSVIFAIDASEHVYKREIWNGIVKNKSRPFHLKVK